MPTVTYGTLRLFDQLLLELASPPWTRDWGGAKVRRIMLRTGAEKVRHFIE
jgi:hypothetical protein